MGCTSAPSPGMGSPEHVDHSTPLGVIKAVSDAARNRDALFLHGLCDTVGTISGEVRRICELTDSTLISSGFVHSFRFADHDPSICRSDSVTDITFMYGPGRDKCGEWVLVKRGTNWYLSDLK